METCPAPGSEPCNASAQSRLDSSKCLTAWRSARAVRLAFWPSGIALWHLTTRLTASGGCIPGDGAGAGACSAEGSGASDSSSGEGAAASGPRASSAFASSTMPCKTNQASKSGSCAQPLQRTSKAHCQHFREAAEQSPYVQASDAGQSDAFEDNEKLEAACNWLLMGAHTCTNGTLMTSNVAGKGIHTLMTCPDIEWKNLDP